MRYVEDGGVRFVNHGQDCSVCTPIPDIFKRCRLAYFNFCTSFLPCDYFAKFARDNLSLNQHTTRRNSKCASYKNVYIIAGPNGSGKTTFAREFLPNYAKCSNFVNADLIAQGLSPFSPRQVALKAGKLVLQQIKEFANRNVDFGFDSRIYSLVLSGPRKLSGVCR